MSSSIPLSMFCSTPASMFSSTPWVHSKVHLEARFQVHHIVSSQVHLRGSSPVYLWVWFQVHLQVCSQVHFWTLSQTYSQLPWRPHFLAARLDAAKSNFKTISGILPSILFIILTIALNDSLPAYIDLHSHVHPQDTRNTQSHLSMTIYICSSVLNSETSSIPDFGQHKVDCEWQVVGAKMQVADGKWLVVSGGWLVVGCWWLGVKGIWWLKL